MESKLISEFEAKKVFSAEDFLSDRNCFDAHFSAQAKVREHTFEKELQAYALIQHYLVEKAYSLYAEDNPICHRKAQILIETAYEWASLFLNAYDERSTSDETIMTDDVYQGVCDRIQEKEKINTKDKQTLAYHRHADLHVIMLNALAALVSFVSFGAPFIINKRLTGYFFFGMRTRSEESVSNCRGELCALKKAEEKEYFIARK